LVEEAAAGQEVVITSSGGSTVRLVPLREEERVAETSSRQPDRKAATDRLKAALETNPAFEAEISTLALLDDSALWNAAQTRMPQSDSERLEELHRKQRLTGLSEAEAHELARLEQQYDRVILVRSHSASLLQHRGHDIRSLTSAKESLPTGDTQAR
jgi:antitoxin (DNA-binding transcriptional repressor) of toxin-antitoxin stability system